MKCIEVLIVQALIEMSLTNLKLSKCHQSIKLMKKKTHVINFSFCGSHQ